MTPKILDLTAIIESLTKEYAGVRRIWQEFVELFAFDRERIDLINDAAPAFFRLVQDLMIEAIVIRIYRITDVENTGSFENLTLERIPNALPEDKKHHDEELKELITSARSQASHVRTWRNKRIAHLDLQHALSDGAQYSIDFTEMRDCIEAIHAVLNRTILIVSDSTFGPEIELTGGTAASLIHVLRRGLAPEKHGHLSSSDFTAHSDP